jgi:3-oxoacyl-[acyl-carrier-protein] synthase-3
MPGKPAKPAKHPLYARIAGTGGYLPERILTNVELERMVDTTDQWIVERTGIRERHIAAPEETTCDLAEQAARQAIAAAGIAASEIDLIIVATTTADQIFPSTACLLQHRLGNRGAPAFDVQAVCTGFIYAIDIANRFIQTGGARTALVVGAETLSRIIDWSDRSTCILFGDGAGAVVLTAAEAPGIISSHLHADGRFASLLQVPAGVSSNRHKLVNGSAYLQMQGKEVFRVAVQSLKRIADETVRANGIEFDAVDWLVPHQANLRIIAALQDKMHLPPERVVVTVDRHGNTSAASVPLALNEAVRDGRIQPGHLVLMEAFGGGFTWGAALVRM